MTKRGVTRSARVAGVLLLLVWVGPVTLVQTEAWRPLNWVGAPDRASAESRMISAGEAVQLAPGTPLKLRLRDGSVAEGRFQQRTLLDSAVYARRFAAAARASGYLPLVLGETLSVALRDCRRFTGPFAGYAQLTLLLRGADGSSYLRVPFESASEIRRANGERVEPGALALAFRAGRVPSAEALALETFPATEGIVDQAGRVQVPAEDIVSATVELPSGNGSVQRDNGSSVVGGIVLGIVVGVVLFYILLGASLRSTSTSGCQSSAIDVSGFMTRAGVRPTTRPFDRDRACYEGDALAVADWWPVPIDAGPPTAFADSPASNASTR